MTDQLQAVVAAVAPTASMSCPATPATLKPAPAPPAVDSTSSSSSAAPKKLECDYDLNPTVLYQAIEAKQWEYAVSLFTSHQQGEQSSTWVIRKETNGKLRWRLLPIHAAVIFGAPLELIELLLEDHPAGAKCKDDQGMLPFHLAFRNEVSWDVMEELLTAFPQAIFVRDRKGRTPLQYGSRSISSSACSVGGAGGGPPSPSSSKGQQAEDFRSFKSVVNILDLYSQISVSGERERAKQEARRMVEASISQLQDAHMAVLSKLKKDWQTQRDGYRQELTRTAKEMKALQEHAAKKDLELASTQTANAELTQEVQRLRHALKDTKLKARSDMGSCSESELKLQQTNHFLRSMIQDLVDEQKVYHVQFQNLMEKYETLVRERQQMQAMFINESNKNTENEQKVVRDFDKWLQEQSSKLKAPQDLESPETTSSPSHHQQKPSNGSSYSSSSSRDSNGSGEEKKVDIPVEDLRDFFLRGAGVQDAAKQGPKDPPPSPAQDPRQRNVM